MKQTAVEWFFNQLENIKDYENLYTRNYMEIDALFNEAKRIEKEQIIQAIIKTIVGSNIIYDKEYPEVTYTAEQYYKETYETKTN